jgi:hypothetical protein
VRTQTAGAEERAGAGRGRLPQGVRRHVWRNGEGIEFGFT